MPIYEQTPVTSNGMIVSTLSSLMTDSSTYIKAHHNYGYALWEGLFFTVSAINNAGFDNFSGGISIAAFRND
jgi:Trk-type K+ transport system membrane component